MSDDNTQRAIGRLEGQMQEVISLLKSQDERSTQSRARMYEAQEKTAREVHGLTSRVGAVEGAVANMDPVFKRVGSLLEQSKGILMVLALVWLFMGGLILEGVKWLGQIAAKAFMGGP
jgi:hypothetical protein